MTQSTDLRPREPDFIAMRTGNQRESHGRARLGNAISACLHGGRLCRTPLLRPIHNYGSRPPSGTEDVGISVFCKDANGQVFHTYSCYSRGVDMLNGAYHYLDLTPKGRDEADQGSNPQAWVRRHDEYKD